MSSILTPERRAIEQLNPERLEQCLDITQTMCERLNRDLPGGWDGISEWLKTEHPEDWRRLTEAERRTDRVMLEYIQERCELSAVGAIVNQLERTWRGLRASRS